MTTETPEQLRKSALAFAAEAYQKVKHNRAYALDEPAKIALGSLARSMFLLREKEGRSHMDAVPNPWTEFAEIIQKLAASGANVLQKRPDAPPPLPKPWLDPVTGEALPNPWKTRNLRAQSILEKRDPALASFYRAMAEDDYGHVAKMQDETAARVAMELIEYGASEHAVNPFRGNDLAAQSAFVKNAPPGVVEFVKNEAEPVSIPLFGRSKNLTTEGALARDPKTFALLQTAQQIRDVWAREDRAAAQAKRAAAEDEIKKLELVT